MTLREFVGEALSEIIFGIDGRPLRALRRAGFI